MYKYVCSLIMYMTRVHKRREEEETCLCDSSFLPVTFCSMGEASGAWKSAAGACEGAAGGGGGGGVVEVSENLTEGLSTFPRPRRGTCSSRLDMFLTPLCLSVCPTVTISFLSVCMSDPMSQSPLSAFRVLCCEEKCNCYS